MHVIRVIKTKYIVDHNILRSLISLLLLSDVNRQIFGFLGTEFRKCNSEMVCTFRRIVQLKNGMSDVGFEPTIPFENKSLNLAP